MMELAAYLAQHCAPRHVGHQLLMIVNDIDDVINWLETNW